MHHDNDNNELRFLSVCSGIEAASVAWRELNWHALAFSEIEKFPSAVLAHHYPDVPNLGDFTKIDPKTLGRVDILCGGTPCQAFSVAGLRQSLGDARGNLSLEFVRLAHELADGNGLRNVVWENVVGVLSTKDNAFGCFLAGLVGGFDALIPSERPADGKSNKHWKWSRVEQRHLVSWPRHGMVSGPKGRAAWAVKDAQFFGVAQRRRRVLVVADFGNGADPAAVLFEPESVCRNPPSRGEAGKDIAPTISARTKGGGGLGTDFDLDGGLLHVPEIARCDATREGSSQDYETTTMVAHAIQAGALRTNPDSGPDGVGVQEGIAYTLEARAEVQAVCVTGSVLPINTQVGLRHEALGERTGLGLGKEGDPAFTLSKSHSHAVFAQTVAIRGRDGGATAELGGEVATALRASQGGGDKPHVLTSAVRRLTPTECERLQGFPDGYTDIPWRGKPKSPDGPRYKALGNSWAVPKFTWLGRRIAALMPAVQQPPTSTPQHDNDNYQSMPAATKRSHA